MQDEFMMAVRARASGGMLASLPLGLDELVWVKWVVAGCWGGACVVSVGGDVVPRSFWLLVLFVFYFH